MDLLDPARLNELWLRGGQHVFLTGISTLAATALGLPLGIAAQRSRALRGPITVVVNILQTVPSLALLALLLALLNRIGAVPAVLALILYALLPIVRNTVTGLDQVSPEVLEAAEGLGMTRSQRLRLVELPLALPVIIAGIRTAAVVGVGIATLSAFIGAGGLGQFINRGLSLNNHQLILLGAVPSALLALAVDGCLGLVQWSLTSKSLRRSPRRRIWRTAVAALPFGLFLLGCLPLLGFNQTRGSGKEVVVVGSKNFTEQLILAELMAQAIEHHTTCRVERRFDLGGTMICHEALVRGGLDLYAEYTGTGLTAILDQPASPDPALTYDTVSRLYRRRWNLVWMEPFGFNNTYVLTIRAADAEERGLDSITDLVPLAPQLRAGWTFEFSERPDGYPALQKGYGLRFGDVRDLEYALMYEALARGEVDVICSFATDGRIAAYHLRMLEDDQQLFPPYVAAPVVHADLLRRQPGVKAALEQLANRIDSPTMQRLNLQVDQEKRRPAEVAREFLEQQVWRSPVQR